MSMSFRFLTLIMLFSQIYLYLSLDLFGGNGFVEQNMD